MAQERHAGSIGADVDERVLGLVAVRGDARGEREVDRRPRVRPRA